MAKFARCDATTNEIAASEAFCRGGMAWTAKDFGLTDRAYTIFSMGPTPVSGPMPVPRGNWIAHRTDPEGAIFGLAALNRRSPRAGMLGNEKQLNARRPTWNNTKSYLGSNG